jgi:hypothetical protein
MAKAFFRFLRGELNGFYITQIQAMCNRISEDYKEFLNTFKNQQMEIGKISPETLDNLGKFAGIYLPRASRSDASTSLRLTESEYDQELDYQFSERGLYKPVEDRFDFEQKTLDDTGLPDINTLATPDKRSSMPGTDDSVIGYIPDDVIEIYDENMHVDRSVVRSTPPENQAYSDFYGDRFAFLSDGITSYESIAPDIFIELFKVMQIIRYNGVSMASLIKITEILCPRGLIRIQNLQAHVNYWSIEYLVDMTAEVDFQENRISMWLYVLKIKFPQLVVTEV